MLLSDRVYTSSNVKVAVVDNMRHKKEKIPQEILKPLLCCSHETCIKMIALANANFSYQSRVFSYDRKILRF